MIPDRNVFSTRNGYKEPIYYYISRGLMEGTIRNMVVAQNSVPYQTIILTIIACFLKRYRTEA